MRTLSSHKNYNRSELIPFDEYEDDEPDYIACRDCKTEWDEDWIEDNGLCPLCY